MPSTRQIDDIWYVKYSIVQWSIKWYYLQDRFLLPKSQASLFRFENQFVHCGLFFKFFLFKTIQFHFAGEKTSSNDLISTCTFCEIQFENKHYMKNDRQIVEIFRERYKLTNFFLGKTILHHQNSSETSYSSRQMNIS